MVEYFSENSFLTILVGISVIGLSATFAVILKRPRLYYLGFSALIIMIGLVIFERAVKTDREVIEDSIFRMADCIRRNDVDGLLEFVSKEHESNYRRIKREMPDYRFQTCQISGRNSPVIDDTTDPKTAKIDFLVFVNVDATLRYGYVGNALRGVTLTYQKESDGVWRVIDYEHYDPRSGN